MFSQFDVKQRHTEQFSDELHFYKARIYQTMGALDNRLQVRILPHMADIPSDEVANLPKYPPFFKGNVIMGKTEVDDGVFAADIVSVVATADFSYGFVLGIVNRFEGNTDQKMSNTYSFKNLKEYLNKRSILPSGFTYEDLLVQHWEESFDSNGNSTGGIMEFYNFRTGDKFIILTSGVIFALTQDKILLRIGAGDNDPLGGKKFSAITMTPNKIKFTTPTFEVDAEHVKLGNKGLKVVGTTAGMVPTSVDGQPIIASSHIVF